MDDMDGLLNGRRVLSGEYSGYPRDSGTAVLLVCMLGNTSFLTRSHVLMNKKWDQSCDRGKVVLRDI